LLERPLRIDHSFLGLEVHSFGREIFVVDSPHYLAFASSTLVYLKGKRPIWNMRRGTSKWRFWPYEVNTKAINKLFLPQRLNFSLLEVMRDHRHKVTCVEVTSQDPEAPATFPLVEVSVWFSQLSSTSCCLQACLTYQVRCFF
jgi:hypothetical protein